MNRFTTFREPETGRTMMKVRRPAKIVDGRLVGSMIDRYEPGFWRVWTPRVKLARKLALAHKLDLRVLDGECEVKVPDALAVELLPRFGAKVKKRLSQETIAKLHANLALAKKTPKRAHGVATGTGLDDAECAENGITGPETLKHGSIAAKTNISHFPTNGVQAA